uniref:Uncharacterized protein n=1 Tax=Arundo donax TaxID=35708 RepID=A0A0A8ZXJ1_ARUDO
MCGASVTSKSRCRRWERVGETSMA